MISDRSCDTNDWINDAKNSALHHRKKINKTNIGVEVVKMFHNIAVLLYFLSNQCSLGEYKRLLLKTLKQCYWPQTLNIVYILLSTLCRVIFQFWFMMKFKNLALMLGHLTMKESHSDWFIWYTAIWCLSGLVHNMNSELFIIGFSSPWRIYAVLANVA